MLVRFWGTRGSLPVAPTADGIQKKIAQALVAANGRTFADEAEADEKDLHCGRRSWRGARACCAVGRVEQSKVMTRRAATLFAAALALSAVPAAAQSPSATAYFEFIRGRHLESLGVQVWTGAKVTGISEHGVMIGQEHIAASTVLWAAGVRASDVGRTLGTEVDAAGRVTVGPDLTIPGHPEVFVVGDMSRAMNAEGKPLPGVALVAMPM